MALFHIHKCGWMAVIIRFKRIKSRQNKSSNKSLSHLMHCDIDAL